MPPELPPVVADPTLRTAETHLSWLVLVGDRVLKAKKPVRTGFIDLTSRAARQRNAELEVALNRRISPDVYQGVATLSGAAGLDEPVVVMRRMPDVRRLARLAADGRDLDAEIVRLAVLLVRFHRAAEPADEVGSTAAALQQWRDNTAQLLADGRRHVDDGQVRRLQGLAELYLAGRGQLFTARRAAGRFRDGHGDLLADDVFLLDDGPRVLDCLEFDAGLRAGDVLSDVAFLAMDLEHLGRVDLAALLLAEHRRGLPDDWPASLADHWTGYRAQVRAKVACLRAGQGDEAAAAEAPRLLDLAERHLRAAQVRLVVVGGPPGSGKSTLAAALGRRLGWPVLRSDAVRAELPAVPGHGSADGAFGRGRYDPAASELVLARLLERAGELLSGGRSVLLDATFGTGAWRAAVAALAERTHSVLVCLQAVVPDDVADDRVAARAAAGTDLSEATVRTARLLRATFAAWPAARRVDTTRPAEDLAAELGPELAAALRPPGAGSREGRGRE